MVKSSLIFDSSPRIEQLVPFLSFGWQTFKLSTPFQGDDTFVSKGDPHKLGPT